MKQDYQTRVNESKVGYVDALKKMFSGASDYVFTDYRGLTVEQITVLRTRLRELSADYRVVKNSFAKIAFQQMDKPDVGEYLVGPTAIALAEKDSAPVVKVLIDFVKEAPTLQVKGALVGGQVYDAAQALAFSKLPSREVLISQLMSVMQAPLQNFVYAANGVPTKLVRTLQAVADQKAAG